MTLIDQYNNLRESGRMPVISVFCNPKDYPGKYVARIFVVEPGRTLVTKCCAVADTLEAIRAQIPTQSCCAFREALKMIPAS